jgi:putative protein kinase ArgK-like GTPase of G3E family
MANENITQMKFLDYQGVSTLWSRIVDKVSTDVNAEAERAKLAEQANATAISAVQENVLDWHYINQGTDAYPAYVHVANALNSPNPVDFAAAMTL